VQRDERDVGPRLAEAGDEVGTDVEGHDLVTERLERVFDARRRLQ
jgi:hypothetical protein